MSYRIIPADADNTPILDRMKAAASVVRAARERQEQELELIESACHAMLADPYKRGVIVEKHAEHVSVYLSPNGQHGVVTWLDMEQMKVNTPVPERIVPEPSGYIGTVWEVINKLHKLPMDTRLFMSGSDLGNDATIMSSDYSPIIESEG